MIRLTSRFDREWFRSLATLEADLRRFATLYHLGPEEAQQLRTAIEALHQEEQVERGGSGQEA